MFHIGLQTRENFFNKTRRVQFQINRFKAYQHLQTTINIKTVTTYCQLTDLIRNILKAWGLRFSSFVDLTVDNILKCFNL